MKAKWNILLIFALVAALAGGTPSPALAEGEPVITDAHVDLEPSIAGASFTTVSLPTDRSFLYVGVNCPSLSKKASFQLDAVEIQ